ncbi:hypothetical protein ACQPWY_25950 [Pseudonocardia xinjiangensis]|uniref:hypothetical protein n=1 Tax=Pseudonocardia xinjiangensis TaxID=75289 RepID=UPI003D90D82D
MLTSRSQRRNAADVEKLRRTLDEESKQRALVQRYQEPLARAAYDLQSRLWNILRGSFLEAHAHEPEGRGWRYARDSTVWLFAQYFGWVEIVRREIQFLPIGEHDESRRLQSALGKVSYVCSSDREISDGTFLIFGAEQRALGELIIVEGQDAEGRTRTSCMGFAAFRAAVEDPDGQLGLWFTKLQEDTAKTADKNVGRERLRLLQHALVDLVDILDPAPAHVRFPSGRGRA